jgi:hypothetical protein
MHDGDGCVVILMPLLPLASLRQEQGGNPERMTYNVAGARANFCMKTLEAPSLSPLTPAAGSDTVPVHNCNIPSRANVSSHTIVGNNAALQCCTLNADEGDTPSYRTRQPRASGPADKARMVMSRLPMKIVGIAGIRGPNPEEAEELAPNVT